MNNFHENQDLLERKGRKETSFFHSSANESNVPKNVKGKAKKLNNFFPCTDEPN